MQTLKGVDCRQQHGYSQYHGYYESSVERDGKAGLARDVIRTVQGSG